MKKSCSAGRCSSPPPALQYLDYTAIKQLRPGAAAHHHHHVSMRSPSLLQVRLAQYYNMNLALLLSCVAAAALLVLLCTSSYSTSSYITNTLHPSPSTDHRYPSYPSLHRHLAFSTQHTSNHILTPLQGLSNMPFPRSQQSTHKAATMAAALHAVSTIPSLSPPSENNPYPMDKAAAAKTPLLGPKVRDWDAQRRAWLAQNPELAPHNGRPNIFLVTGSRPKACENPSGDRSLLIFMKNKVDYCRLHNIEIFYNMAQFDSEMTEYWSKLPLLRTLMLSHPEMEWLWWMDSDAMITDMAFELPMEKYEQHNLIIPGNREEVFIKRSWVGLNAGIFLIRNCQWSLDLIDTWALMGPMGKAGRELGKMLSETLPDRPLFDSDDQSSLIYLLLTQKEIWESKVVLESSYCLHGYWVGIVDRFEELTKSSHPGYGDERWPFVTHFVGCKPCGRYASYGQERCLEQMERAFNFADNQVLQHYGFQHKQLNTGEVVRMQKKTSTGLISIRQRGAVGT